MTWVAALLASRMASSYRGARSFSENTSCCTRCMEERIVKDGIVEDVVVEDRIAEDGVVSQRP